MNSPNKRPKLTEASETTPDISDIKIFFVPERIQKQRLLIMQNCAKNIGFDLSKNYNSSVSHIVTDFEDEEQVLRALKIDVKEWLRKKSRAKMVKTKWFTDSAKVKEPLPVSPDYCLNPLKSCTEARKCAENTINKHDKLCICQRAARLNHHNKRFTDALEVLALEAELRDTTSSYSRALAFRRAAAMLKSLSNEVKIISVIENLKDIGKHSLKVIQDILELGYSEEVQNIEHSEWFRTMKLFTGIYGVGPSTANKWYDAGFRTVGDLVTMSNIINPRRDKRIDYGLAFFDDLSTPVTSEEAQQILQIVKKNANAIQPGVTLSLTGGFRRGKPSGHDVDILLTHPEQGKERRLLKHLHKRLKKQGYILHALFEEVKSEEFMLNHSKDNTMDNYEKCFYIMRLPIDRESSEPDIESSFALKRDQSNDFEHLCSVASEKRSWIARRVDLVVAPITQFPYALVGWTGNKQFNRSLRHYAKKELNLKLTSHGLYCAVSRKWLEAKTEEDVFKHLNLGYLHPHDRNP